MLDQHLDFGVDLGMVDHHPVRTLSDEADGNVAIALDKNRGAREWAPLGLGFVFGHVALVWLGGSTQHNEQAA